jgi:non-heme chloroperoxidase
MTLRHDAMGSGTPVVFVHGAFTHRRVFGYQLLSLSRRHRVIAVDLPGHGRSPWDPDRAWFTQAVQGVAGVVRELKLVRPTLVGWSVGANVARAVAADVDDTSLVLVGAPGRPIDERARGAVGRYLVRDFPRYARTVVRTFAFAPVSEDTEAWLFNMALSLPVDVVAATLLDEIDEPPAVPPGAVLIHGTHDQVVPFEERLRGDGPEHVFERSGHMPFIEERDRFEAVVSATAG